MEINKDYLNIENKFYNLGGFATRFYEVKKFLENEIENISENETFTEETNKLDEVQYTFEYIDCKEKLMLPLFFKALIENVSNENMENYTNYIYNAYSLNNNKLKIFLKQIISISNIPVEILSKYFARLYTFNSDFYKNLNKDLGVNKKDKHLPYIKTLYQGVKLKSLPLASNNILYRGAKISYEEINKIKEYIKNKIKDLPSSIVFSKSFLSFLKEKIIALRFLNQFHEDKNLSKVLFILEKDDNIGYNLSTHGDIENISCFPEEKEVLFFPFSSFEIKDINEINIGNKKLYVIKLLYLGKYLKDIESDKNLVINENKLPDSEFKRQLSDFALIRKEKIENINKKILYEEYKHYEKEISENIIIGEIKIDNCDVYKDIQIINSFENVKRSNLYKVKMNKMIFDNEKEIKENIGIKHHFL